MRCLFQEQHSKGSHVTFILSGYKLYVFPRFNMKPENGTLEQEIPNLEKCHF